MEYSSQKNYFFTPTHYNMFSLRLFSRERRSFRWWSATESAAEPKENTVGGGGDLDNHVSLRSRVMKLLV